MQKAEFFTSLSLTHTHKLDLDQSLGIHGNATRYYFSLISEDISSSSFTLVIFSNQHIFFLLPEIISFLETLSKKVSRNNRGGGEGRMTIFTGIVHGLSRDRDRNEEGVP